MTVMLVVSVAAQLCLTFCDPHGRKPARLLCIWDSPGKSTGVGCHFPLAKHLCISFLTILFKVPPFFFQSMNNIWILKESVFY